MENTINIQFLQQNNFIQLLIANLFLSPEKNEIELQVNTKN